MSADHECECPRCGARLQLVWTGEATYRRNEWHALVDDVQRIEAQPERGDKP